MDLVSRATFRRLLRGLSPGAFATFVAALYAARGAETRVVSEDGVTRIVVERAERCESLRPVTEPGSRPAIGGDERLVIAHPAETPADHARLVDADELYSMLLYAVSRKDADDLCRRFFDQPLVTVPPRPRSRAATAVSGLPEHSASLVVGVVGLLLVVSGVFGGTAGFDDTEVPVFGASPPPGDASTAVETAGNATAGSDATTPSAVDPLSVEALPPGLGPTGITDADRLADGHAKAVTGRSYQWTLTHREFVGDPPSSYRRETVFVESPWEYVSTLEAGGDLQHPTYAISSSEIYADGQTRYTRRLVADEIEVSYGYTARPVQAIRNGEGPNANRAETYLEWFLSVEGSQIVDIFERDETRYYWIALWDDPYPGVENTTGRALIDEHGVVHEIQREYDVPDTSGVRVVVSLRYTDFDETTAEPPEWLPTAKSRTE